MAETVVPPDATAPRRAALREPAPSEADAWDAAPCGLVLIDADGTIRRVNRTLAAWVGATAAGLAGRPFADLLTPSDRRAFDTEWLPLLRARAGFDAAALRLNAGDGAGRAVLATARAGETPGLIRLVLFDAGAGTAEIAALRAEVDETRACLLAVLDSVADGLAVIGPALTPVYQNARAERAFRLPGVAQRVALLDALAPSERSWLAAACAAVRRGGESWLRERRIERPNAWVEFRLVPIGSLVVVFFTDVSARRVAAAERQRVQARIGHMARHDALTGLPNRLDFRDRLDQALSDCAVGQRCALLALDLDRFRQVNDTWGQSVGDTLLRQVADRLRALVRAPGCAVRLGGDQFAVLASGLAAPSGAGRLAERIVAQIGQPFEIEGRRVVVGASVGIALGPDDATTAIALMALADTALHAAKRAGGNTYRFAAD
jgi:diguanylate cyclase (GGDEF)-like protein/PAS domain S-box-containing protein